MDLILCPYKGVLALEMNFTISANTFGHQKVQEQHALGFAIVLLLVYKLQSVLTKMSAFGVNVTIFFDREMHLHFLTYYAFML